MRIIHERHAIGSRFNVDGQDCIVCGPAVDGRPMIARKWTRENYNYAPGMIGDYHLFAPTVRQLRQRQGYAHDANAKKGVIELFGKHEGADVIVLGCGPSLGMSLDVVRTLRNEHGHIVIGTNNCLQLGWRNVIDYYMLLCWLTQAWWWWGCDTSKIKCVTSFHTTPEVIRDFPDRYYFDDTFLDVTIDRPEHRKTYGCLDGGMSVTYSALHLAFLMGAHRIILFGMDLAYTGNMDHQNDPLTFDKACARGVQVVKDINGNAILTDRSLTAQRYLLKGQIKLLEESGIEIVNATGAGTLDVGVCATPNGYLDDVKQGNWYLKDGLKGKSLAAVP